MMLGFTRREWVSAFLAALVIVPLVWALTVFAILGGSAA